MGTPQRMTTAQILAQLDKEFAISSPSVPTAPTPASRLRPGQRVRVVNGQIVETLPAPAPAPVSAPASTPSALPALAPIASGSVNALSAPPPSLTSQVRAKVGGIDPRSQSDTLLAQTFGGIDQAARGAESVLALPGPRFGKNGLRFAPDVPKQAMAAFSDMVEGMGRASVIALPAFVAAAPVVTALTLAAGAAAGKGAEMAARSAGLSPEAQRAAANAAMLVATTAGVAEGFLRGKATKAGKIGVEVGRGYAEQAKAQTAPAIDVPKALPSGSVGPIRTVPGAPRSPYTPTSQKALPPTAPQIERLATATDLPKLESRKALDRIVAESDARAEAQKSVPLGQGIQPQSESLSVPRATSEPVDVVPDEPLPAPVPDETVAPQEPVGQAEGEVPVEPEVAPQGIVEAPAAPVEPEPLELEPTVEAPPVKLSKREAAKAAFEARKAERVAAIPPEIKRELQRILAELDAQQYEAATYTPLDDMTFEATQSLATEAAQGRGAKVVGTGSPMMRVSGHAGAPVYQDIVQAIPPTERFRTRVVNGEKKQMPTRTTGNQSQGSIVASVKKYLDTGDMTDGARGALLVAKARLGHPDAAHVVITARPMPDNLVPEQFGGRPIEPSPEWLEQDFLNSNIPPDDEAMMQGREPEEGPIAPESSSSQPELIEGVRGVENPTPQLEAPYSLTPEVAVEKAAPEPDLFAADRAEAAKAEFHAKKKTKSAARSKDKPQARSGSWRPVGRSLADLASLRSEMTA